MSEGISVSKETLILFLSVFFFVRQSGSLLIERCEGGLGVRFHMNVVLIEERAAKCLKNRYTIELVREILEN